MCERQVRKLYEKSFFVLRRTPKPKTMELEEEFTKVLENLMNSVSPPSLPSVRDEFCFCARFTTQNERNLAPCNLTGRRGSLQHNTVQQTVASGLQELFEVELHLVENLTISSRSAHALNPESLTSPAVSIIATSLKSTHVETKLLSSMQGCFSACELMCRFQHSP